VGRACQYRVGLLSDLPRKNGQTLAASIADVPNAQSIRPFLAVSPWSARELDRRRVQHALEVACSGRECTVVLDEVSILKQGRHSVGAKRQSLGCVGKTANGQVAVTLHHCDDRYDWPITGQLYLPREWAEDQGRRQRARVPEDVPFATKAHAMALLAEARPWGCAGALPRCHDPPPKESVSSRRIQSAYTQCVSKDRRRRGGTGGLGCGSPALRRLPPTHGPRGVAA
jgi:hypothetical protein